MTKEKDLNEKRRALIDFLNSSKKVQENFSVAFSRGWLPPEWDDFDRDVEIKRTRKRVTLRLDEDVLEFFRYQGKNYQALINHVLRTFVMGRISNALYVREAQFGAGDLIDGFRQSSAADLKWWSKNEERAQKIRDGMDFEGWG